MSPATWHDRYASQDRKAPASTTWQLPLSQPLVLAALISTSYPALISISN